MKELQRRHVCLILHLHPSICPPNPRSSLPSLISGFFSHKKRDHSSSVPLISSHHFPFSSSLFLPPTPFLFSSSSPSYFPPLVTLLQILSFCCHLSLFFSSSHLPPCFSSFFSSSSFSRPSFLLSFILSTLYSPSTFLFSLLPPFSPPSLLLFLHFCVIMSSSFPFEVSIFPLFLSCHFFVLPSSHHFLSDRVLSLPFLLFSSSIVIPLIFGFFFHMSFFLFFSS